MKRLTICLQESEKNALRILAEKEFRDPRSQAAYIIRQVLDQSGLLEIQINQENSRKEVKNER